jgi:hypothetical protein
MSRFGKFYILDDERRPVRASMIEWAIWFEPMDNRRVAETLTKHYRISTLFTRLDHRFIQSGPALLFETMVFERKGMIRRNPLTGRLWLVHEDLRDPPICLVRRRATGHAATVRRYQKLVPTPEAANDRMMEMKGNQTK